MTIYIAGPMRGIADFNFPAFDAAADRFRQLGFDVINPADLDREQDKGSVTTDAQATDMSRVYAKRDTEALLKCTHIAMLPGWQKSVGATAEYHFAKWIGLVMLDAETGKELGVASEVRSFETGATRHTDVGKPDYEGYLSPLALREFGVYMTRNRSLPDGSTRASDNWQRGIPRDQYMKSMWRHFHDLWTMHRGYEAYDHTGKLVTMKDALSAILFNTQGYFHEYLKAEMEKR